VVIPWAKVVWEMPNHGELQSPALLPFTLPGQEHFCRYRATTPFASLTTASAEVRYAA
jgi:hypothetical protein